jgi:hypothetical protein
VKKIICGILLILLTSCSNPPNFTQPIIITMKESNTNPATHYTGIEKSPPSLQRTPGNTTTFFDVEFYAPEDFANIGDTVILQGKHIEVVPKEKK